MQDECWVLGGLAVASDAVPTSAAPPTAAFSANPPLKQ